MKISSIIVGLLIGGLLGFGLAKYFTTTTAHAKSAELNEPDTATSSWTWPDSLDAVHIAPASHKIVYEDSVVRILQVILNGNETEPIHTHQWKSVMWFSNATAMTYYVYNLSGGQYQIQDSIAIPQMPAEALNHGEHMDAEGPHAIRNLSDETGIAYRVEFKKEFNP